MIRINNKKFLSYEEQVLKNKEDIQEIKDKLRPDYIVMKGVLRLQAGYTYDLVDMVRLGELKPNEYEIHGVVRNDGTLVFEGNNFYTVDATSGNKIVIRKTISDTFVKLNNGVYESVQEPESVLSDELFIIDVTKVVIGGE